MENCRCNCCGGNQGNWGWGINQNQDKCKGHDNNKKDNHKYCCCWEEKDDCYYEKDFSKCGCSHNKFESNNCDYGLENKHSCGCQNNNYGYDKFNQNNFGWY